MRSKAISAVTLLLALSGSVQAQDTGLPPTWSLKAKVNGVDLVGDWELARIRATNGDAVADQAAANSQVSVVKDSVFQINVDIVSPNGVNQNVSGSPNLIYRPQGCLSISANGVATVATAPSRRWTCNAGDVIPLTIVYKDTSTMISAMNMYLLKIE